MRAREINFDTAVRIATMNIPPELCNICKPLVLQTRNDLRVFNGLCDKVQSWFAPVIQGFSPPPGWEFVTQMNLESNFKFMTAILLSDEPCTRASRIEYCVRTLSHSAKWLNQSPSVEKVSIPKLRKAVRAAAANVLDDSTLMPYVPGELEWDTLADGIATTWRGYSPRVQAAYNRLGEALNKILPMGKYSRVTFLDGDNPPIVVGPGPELLLDLINLRAFRHSIRSDNLVDLIQNHVTPPTCQSSFGPVECSIGILVACIPSATRSVTIARYPREEKPWFTNRRLR